RITTMTVNKDDNIVQSPKLGLANYPNPFNPETTISYNLAEATPVELNIYNLKGQLVRTLVSEVQNAGNYSVVWKGTDTDNNTVSSGIYLYQIKTNLQIKTNKAILLK
ncbi:MAG: T9SS type A sorting domain-containing protein, partial [Candidatus Cloacimonetes bacterium]|nr:T9SS type A sorting domain-containing protein [Candidatus Cloacimonadota bacterium]